MRNFRNLRKLIRYAFETLAEYTALDSDIEVSLSEDDLKFGMRPEADPAFGRQPPVADESTQDAVESSLHDSILESSLLSVGIFKALDEAVSVARAIAAEYEISHPLQLELLQIMRDAEGTGELEQMLALIEDWRTKTMAEAQSVMNLIDEVVYNSREQAVGLDFVDFMDYYYEVTMARNEVANLISARHEESMIAVSDAFLAESMTSGAQEWSAVEEGSDLAVWLEAFTENMDPGEA